MNPFPRAIQVRKASNCVCKFLSYEPMFSKQPTIYMCGSISIPNPCAEIKSVYVGTAFYAQSLRSNFPTICVNPLPCTIPVQDATNYMCETFPETTHVQKSTKCKCESICIQNPSPEIN